MSLRNKLDLQSFGDAFSLKNWWSEKYVLFVQCIHVLILIKLQILLYILLEKLKLHCNLHEKLAQDLFVPWELDSLGMKRFILQTLALAFCGIWLLTTASWSVSEQKSVPFFYLYRYTWKLSFLTKLGNRFKTCQLKWYQDAVFPFFFPPSWRISACGPLVRSHVSSILGECCVISQLPDPLAFSARTSLLLGAVLSWRPLLREIPWPS